MLSLEDCWVPPSRHLREEGHAGNRAYIDYRFLRWADVVECAEIEQQLLTSVAFGKESASKARLLLTLKGVDHLRLNDDDAEDALYDLHAELSDAEHLINDIDIGCATAVGALAAAKCPPVSSCNGATFGGQHSGKLAYVAFHANPTRLDLLNRAATLADVNVEVSSEGFPILYATSGCSGLLEFGRFMNELRGKIPLNHARRETRTKGERDQEQPLLEMFKTYNA